MPRLWRGWTAPPERNVIDTAYQHATPAHGAVARASSIHLLNRNTLANSTQYYLVPRMSRKAKKQTYKAKREYCPETGRDMIVGTRRGTVRFYGNGPMVKPSTAAWFYDGAQDSGKPIGEFMDAIAEAYPKAGFGSHVERHLDDDFVPTTP